MKNKSNKSLIKRIDLENLMTLFLEEKELENKSKATVKFYHENLERFFNFLANELKIENPSSDDFSLDTVNEYRRSLKGKNKEVLTSSYASTKKEKISDNTYATYIRAIRVFGNWLYKMDYTEFDILKYIDTPKEFKKKVKILEEDEIKTVFDSFDLKTELGYRDYLICRFAFDYGFRLGSIVKIKKSDIDFSRSTIKIWLKGNKEENFRLDKEMKVKLQKFIIKYNTNDTDFLFLTKRGEPITENTIIKMFNRLKDATGINELSCHMLRHNFATNYIGMGHSVEELKYQLGHETTKISERYLTLSHSLKHLTKEHDSMLRQMKSKEEKTSLTQVRRRIKVS